MIFDSKSNLVVGNVGWIDEGALWTFDPISRKEETIPIEGTKYLTLRAGSEGLFRLVHHGCPNQTVSIRRLAEPSIVLASIEIANGTPRFHGDLALWQHVDPTAIFNTEQGQRLLFIAAHENKIVDLDLTWYSSENYDLDYQGLTDCMLLDPTQVIVSVQRSSDLVIINLDRNTRVGTIPLANRGGNPVLTMRTQADFFASDYDTLCRVDAKTLKVVASHLLQEGGAGNMRQFIGDYDLGWGACVVARPFSGDVLRLEPETFKITARAAVGGQPLQVCLTSDSQVVTRDWQTGSVAISELRLRPWWKF
ncbi:MAG TPA: hypothetical protein VG819_08045 [Rhizomicrobium sp.]|jgi:hypothetical protein|nr:hypothetical protein [Rhizomicrobium sp.]